MGWHGLDLSGSGKGQVAGARESGSQPLECTQYRDFLG